MAYQFDAFFSYKRDPESDDWHERAKDKLTFWLKQYLGRSDVSIFFDREDIRTGARWHMRLTEALKTSRCLVCLWSPLYFTSKWCVSEWKTFEVRSKESGRDLVLPAAYFDGQTFPRDARAVQFRDFSKYASTMPRFWETEAAVRFEDVCLRPFSDDVADAIRRAPTYDDRFRIVEVPDSDVQPEGTIPRIADA